MGLYWKAVGAVMLAVVMMLMLRRQELGILLGIAVCAMAAMAALDYLQPVKELLDSLRSLGDLDGGLISVLLKAVGIGFLTEVAALVCADSGNGSLGRALQFLGTAVILWMSIPLFSSLLELIQEILNRL